MQTRADTFSADDIIVADNREHRWRFVPRMHREVHSGFNLYGFIRTDQWPLDHVVTLAMRIQAKLGRKRVALHEFVVGEVDVAAFRARLDEAQRKFLGFAHCLEAVLQFV